MQASQCETININKNMKRTKVTTDDLRDMAIGKTEVYQLDSVALLNSGLSLAYRLQHELGCKFKTETDREKCRLTITKLPKT